MSDQFRVFIPINFFMLFFESPLCIFNGELVKGGAFRIRAVGATDDGRPVRSQDYIFFRNGFFSMAVPSTEMQSLMREKSGFEVIVTRKKQKEEDRFYWEVEANKKMFLRGESHGLRTLCRSNLKPQPEGVIMLCGVDGNPGQYIYLK